MSDPPRPEIQAFLGDSSPLLTNYGRTASRRSASGLTTHRAESIPTVLPCWRDGRWWTGMGLLSTTGS